MTEYAILLNPGHNRVYFESSLALSLCELEAASAKMSSACANIKTRDIGGVTYITFASEERLDGGDIRLLSRMSFAYAIFELGEECLIPVKKDAEGFIDGGISSMLKYQGKTNELFTRLMINLAFYTCKSTSGTEKARLLDPVAGKGTTLLEGLVAGFDVAGIELMDKPVQELEVFFKKYLENARYKHTYKKERMSGAGFRATLHSFEIARTKEDFKSADKKGSFLMVSGDSRFADKYFRRNSFDTIVGDLPYGIAHGNMSRGKAQSSRNPAELLSECLPSWRTVLKPGGSMALSWNAFVLPRSEITGIITRNGFTVLEEKAFGKLEHRVDQAIKRDVVIAVKT